MDKKLHAVQEKRRRESKVKRGLCEVCGKQPFLEGYRKCVACRADNSRRSLDWRAAKRKAGICRYCVNAVIPGKIYCQDCRDKQSIELKTKRIARVSSGTCAECDQAPLPNLKLCKKHRDQDYTERAKRKKLYEASGLCGNCGKAEPITQPDRKKKVCEICYLKPLARIHLGATGRWQELRDLFSRQSVCPYTGIQLVLGSNASVDHIVPRSVGGLNELSNLQFVYNSGSFDVNSMKGYMRDSEFRQAIKLMALHLNSKEVT